MRHLNDLEFAALVAGEKDPAAGAHAATCSACAHEVDRVRAFTVEFRKVTADSGLRAALAPPRWAGIPRRWVPLAAAFAGLVLAAAALVHRAPSPQQLPETPLVQKDAADDLLLLEVEGDISRSGPKALAPASLIVQARNKQAQTYATKESQ